LTDAGTTAIICIGDRTVAPPIPEQFVQSESLRSRDRRALQPVAASPARLHQFVEECLAGNDLLKGGLLLAVLWWLWMEPHPEQARRRELVVVAIIAR